MHNNNEPQGTPIIRTGLFIIAFQLEGLCSALRQVVPNGLQPSCATIALLKKLRDDFASISEGRSLENFPAIDDALSATDILVVAETLRSTVISFLTPDEQELRKQTLGFRKPSE